MEEEILIEKKYSIPYDTFYNAFAAFQKKFVYPRNYVIIAVFLLLAVINCVYIGLGYGVTLNYVMVCVCIAFAFINWFNPKKIRRKLMESIKGIEGDVYSLKLLPDKLLIGTVLEPTEEKKEDFEEVFDSIDTPEEIAETEIFLTSDVKVVEKSEFFIIYIKRAMFYVVPKKDFSEEEITVMQLHFEKQLGRNYISDVKNK